ncbi:MAG: T9SS type A sorting domain-containing protein [Bacteroidales bacterium]|nr:T9SS type A sorting domain-containing protein [Bacteroidales bacterium]
MKKSHLLFLALVLIGFNCFAQWVTQNSGISTHLLSVYFTDSNTGYIGGWNNQLLKTQDGGTTWETSNPPAGFGDIFSITFTDANTGYAAGLYEGGGSMLTTIDAGSTWTYNQTCCDAVPLFSIFFADTNIGYAVGDEDGGGWHYYIYKTIDGGTTWFFESGGEGEQFSSIFFTDASTGFAVGTSIIKTTDGGTTWDTVFDIPPTDWLLSVFFTDANTGYAVGNSIIKTTDGGTTWDTVFDVPPTNWLLSVFFTDANTGYAVGDSGTIIKTIDAGLIWEVQSSGTTNDLQSIYFPTFDTGYIVGNNGTLIKTTNGGSYNGCLPEGITFTNQTQIDSFQTNYPGCTEIEGFVKIGGIDIANLNGLSILNSIGGNLEIGSLGPDNPLLINLTGLDNLTHIGGDLAIFAADALIDLSGLENLDSIGGSLHVTYNNELTSIAALENLIHIGGSIGISMNYELTSLAGLEGIITLEGGVSIEDNELLNDLSGLNSLTTIGGNLHIGENDALINLSGLDNLTSIAGDLAIGPFPPGHEASALNRNSALTSLSGLNSLTSVGGNLSIYGNGALTNIEALENLTQIGGSLGIGFLCCWGENVVNYTNGNPSLTSLSGLENIDEESIDSLYIIGNSSLSTCDVQSICSYLASPNGSVDIYGNAPGCNDAPDIANACGITLPCLPYGNYYLTSQDDIDDFQAVFQNCTDLEGNVLIYGFDITNLNGLNTISSIEGYLAIGSTSLLSDLTGLGSLRIVKKGFNIYHNSILTSLAGLDKLDSVGGSLTIYNNDSLTSLTGLENLRTIAGSLSLGTEDWFTWYGNPVLSDISALENIEAGSIEYLKIVHNDSLADCTITSICDYLASPGAVVSISQNAPGCNSQEEVGAACDTLSVRNTYLTDNFVLFPNPANHVVTITSKSGTTIREVIIYNQTGQKIYCGFPENNTLDISKLKPGIYIIDLGTGNLTFRKKLIIQ